MIQFNYSVLIVREIIAAKAAYLILYWSTAKLQVFTHLWKIYDRDYAQNPHDIRKLYKIPKAWYIITTFLWRVREISI